MWNGMVCPESNITFRLLRAAEHELSGNSPAKDIMRRTLRNPMMPSRQSIPPPLHPLHLPRQLILARDFDLRRAGFEFGNLRLRVEHVNRQQVGGGFAEVHAST